MQLRLKRNEQKMYQSAGLIHRDDIPVTKMTVNDIDKKMSLRQSSVLRKNRSFVVGVILGKHIEATFIESVPKLRRIPKSL